MQSWNVFKTVHICLNTEYWTQSRENVAPQQLLLLIKVCIVCNDQDKPDPWFCLLEQNGLILRKPDFYKKEST